MSSAIASKPIVLRTPCSQSHSIEASVFYALLAARTHADVLSAIHEHRAQLQFIRPDAQLTWVRTAGGDRRWLLPVAFCPTRYLEPTTPVRVVATLGGSGEFGMCRVLEAPLNAASFDASSTPTDVALLRRWAGAGDAPLGCLEVGDESRLEGYLLFHSAQPCPTAGMLRIAAELDGIREAWVLAFRNVRRAALNAEFTAILAASHRATVHDLRNSLGVLDGYVFMFDTDSADWSNEELSEARTSLRQSVRAMTGVLSDPVGLARIDVHRPESTPIEVNAATLRTLVDSVTARVFGEAARSSRLDVDRLHEPFLIDETRFGDALAALVSALASSVPSAVDLELAFEPDADRILHACIRTRGEPAPDIEAALAFLANPPDGVLQRLPRGLLQARMAVAALLVRLLDGWLVPGLAEPGVFELHAYWPVSRSAGVCR